MMKEIRWSQTFTRHYKQRIAQDEQLTAIFWDSVEAFVEDPTLVDDHALTNVMQSKRAFSVSDEYRVVYIEGTDYITFIDVGTHPQVYRRS